MKRGDTVSVLRDFTDRRSGKDYGTVVSVRRWSVRVLFPIRKFVWVPKSFCKVEAQ